MSAEKFMIEIAVVCVAALAGGLLARKLGQPVVLGYLLAGVLVGPNTPGFVADTQTVSAIAEWGVVFLLFAVGVEFSLRSLTEMRGTGAAIGIVQVTLSSLLGYGLGRAFGFGNPQSVLLGFIIAMSSTMIVLKVLDERGENDSYHGRMMLAILIAQDLLVVVLAAAVPFMSETQSARLPLLGSRILLGGLYLGVTMLLAFLALPKILNSVAASKSRELFVLAVISISFAAAIVTDAIGFSLALGAFVAGLLVSESQYSHMILAEIKPFRDFFAAIFFASIGMLAQPTVLVHQFWMLAALIAAVMVGKFLIVWSLMMIFRLNTRLAVTAGLGLAQIGEFSFVLAQIGVHHGILSDSAYALIVMAAVITMFSTPIGLRLGPRLVRLAKLLPWASTSASEESSPVVLAGDRHIILCGYGRVGARIGKALQEAGGSFTAIDYDNNTARAALREGVTAIYGDAANVEIIMMAGAASASAAVVTIPDPIASSLSIGHLRSAKPDIRILARAHTQKDVERLYASGADTVVWPELEAGIEMIRQLASYFGWDPESMLDAIK